LEIAKRLKNARELSRKSQTQVSRDTGINNKTLSGYERGVSEPDLKTFNLLAQYYKVSVEYLLGNSNDPFAKNYEEVPTIAAHKDGKEFTKEELQDIEDFKEYVRSKRNK